MGLKEPLDKVGTHMKRTVFYTHDTGVILDEKTYHGAEAQLGAPLWQIHRADLHDILLAKVKELDIPLIMGARVQSYNPDEPSLTLEDGTVLKADVILAADGECRCHLFKVRYLTALWQVIDLVHETRCTDRPKIYASVVTPLLGL